MLHKFVLLVSSNKNNHFCLFRYYNRHKVLHMQIVDTASESYQFTVKIANALKGYQELEEYTKK